MKIIPLFPSTLHAYDVKDFDKEELVDYIYGEYDSDPKGRVISNRGGWQSSFDYTYGPNPILDAVERTLRHEFFSITLKYGQEFHIEDLWININKPGSFNHKHDHPGSVFSGVFWINAPKDSGQLVFDNPNTFTMWDEMSSYSDQFQKILPVHPAYYMTPTEGMIILFPSSLYHKVDVNQSEEDRISVSFNIGR
jgi:uncharacterized protein (TIGR02466 family)